MNNIIMQKMLMDEILIELRSACNSVEVRKLELELRCAAICASRPRRLNWSEPISVYEAENREEYEILMKFCPGVMPSDFSGIQNHAAPRVKLKAEKVLPPPCAGLGVTAGESLRLGHFGARE